jgi:hypothetical protein
MKQRFDRAIFFASEISLLLGDSQILFGWNHAQDNFPWLCPNRIGLSTRGKDISRAKVWGAHQPRYIFQMVGTYSYGSEVS